MSDIVRLKVPSQPNPRRAQTGILRTSVEMADMLGDIAGAEECGGMTPQGCNDRTLTALRKRGLVADYDCHGPRVCLSPVGRNVLRSWRR